MNLSTTSALLIAILVSGLAACSGETPSGNTDAAENIEATGAKENRTLNIDPQLEPFVTQARSDLANHLEIDPAEIDILDAGFVTWPNSALGCPAPDMMYTQALVPGYRIALNAGGERHEYHGAVGKPPFRCPPDRIGKPAAGSANTKDVT